VSVRLPSFDCKTIFQGSADRRRLSTYKALRHRPVKRCVLFRNRIEECSVESSASCGSADQILMQAGPEFTLTSETSILSGTDPELYTRWLSAGRAVYSNPPTTGKVSLALFPHAHVLTGGQSTLTIPWSCLPAWFPWRGVPSGSARWLRPDPRLKPLPAHDLQPRPYSADCICLLLSL
jgi:hypothetical protein